VFLGVCAAAALHHWMNAVSLMVAAVAVGALISNAGLSTNVSGPGLRFASKTVLRFGIVLLGLRLSFGDVAGLGVATLLVIVTTVAVTFFAVQFIGRKVGVTPGLSVLVASGFSICGNSAIASVQGVVQADDEDVAAAIGLVTLCGTLAILVVPSLGAALGLSDVELGVWAGASVQDTAQVIAVASAAGPAVLAVATAVKLTRVVLLAPIVAGIAVWRRRSQVDACAGERSPAVLPAFVVGFLVMMAIRSTRLVPDNLMDLTQAVQRYALAAGAVGLGSSVRVAALRRLGAKPLVLGVVAWAVVGGVSLLCIRLIG